MAASEYPEALQSFLARNRSNLPAVVEVAEGIYGSHEPSSEARDFSNGDILRLLSVREKVNITFDAVYSAASQKGLITVDRDFSGGQFKVVSHFRDGHVYDTFNQMLQDCPEFVHATRQMTIGDAVIRKGDRLKLVDKSTAVGECWIRSRNLRTSQTIKLTEHPMGAHFAKNVNKSQLTVSMSDLYHRLPQRVRLVRNVGEVIRRCRGEVIPGLDPDFDGEMILSKTEIVEACPWENPERIFYIPMSTDLSVYPRKDWGDKIGPVVDIHELAKEASPESMKAAVVVDQESRVPGCPKDTILLIHDSYTQKFAIAKGRNNAHALIPRSYPSLFKLTVEPWRTVEDLLQANMHGDVHVGTTVKNKHRASTDVLYEHDIVRLTGSEPEPFGGAYENYEAVQMYRSQSQLGEVGPITVAVDARADFYENAPLLGDNPVGKILGLGDDLPVQVTLSRPHLLRQPHEIDADDDLLLNMSPLEITGQCELRVVIGTILTSNQRASDDNPDVIVVPETKKLAMRSLNQPVRLKEIRPLSCPVTKVIRVSQKEVDSLHKDTYSVVPPPLPRRKIIQPTLLTPPGRPFKSPHLRQQLREHEKPDEKPQLPPPRGPSSTPSSPVTSPRRGAFPKLLAGLRPRDDRASSTFPRFPERSTEMRSQAENPYHPIAGHEVRRTCYEDGSHETVTSPHENTLSSDDDEYEKPNEIPRYCAPSRLEAGFPPRDDNISGFGQVDMIHFLEYLNVSRCVIDTFRRKQIDGKKLVDLRERCTDESLQEELGVEALNDWFALLHFITKSSSKT